MLYCYGQGLQMADEFKEFKEFKDFKCSIWDLLDELGLTEEQRRFIEDMKLGADVALT
ncbi:Uncharacterised protein [Klebsiella pneumoniae]|nr:Uncharacterised protein [Klebsiella pneumoniae]SWZ61544.1 Uncharacterised protein [Klebsiella pneumoniae]VVK91133.1 Uncharacterised protein [Klebsiella pneumoniae]